MTLPGDIEIDLYRISNGEPVRWKGMSSGVYERMQGVAILVGAAVFALVTLPGALEGLAELDRIVRGQGSAGDAVFALFSLTGAAVAAGIGWFGWRTLQSANRVAWAVTSKRLIRFVGGDADNARSWTRSDILKVERKSTSGKESLAVTVRARSRNDRSSSILIIIGPTDLGDAERALAMLED